MYSTGFLIDYIAPYTCVRKFISQNIIINTLNLINQISKSTCD